MSSNSQSHHVLEEIGFSLVVIFFACCLDLNVYFVLALKHDSYLFVWSQYYSPCRVEEKFLAIIFLLCFYLSKKIIKLLL